MSNIRIAHNQRLEIEKSISGRGFQPSISIMISTHLGSEEAMKMSIEYREDFSKKREHSPHTINPNGLQKTVDMINFTPRKLLNYSTTYDLYYKKFKPILNSC